MVELSLNNLQKKFLIILGGLLSDIGLSLWLYFKAGNYTEYLKYASTITDSPDFQVQLYKVYLQSLTFGLLLFVATHIVIYALYWKEFKAAKLYVKFYTAFSSMGCLILAVAETPYALLPAMIYGLSYYTTAKMFPLKAQN